MPYPYSQANSGDFDLIGQRKPQNYWRVAVSGRSPVETLVERPTPPGTEQVAVWWGYFDELASWTWDVKPAHPIKVHVYTPGDSARLVLNGEEIPATTPERGMATFTVPYRPGELTAIAHHNGKEIGRKTFRVATSRGQAREALEPLPRSSPGPWPLPKHRGPPAGDRRAQRRPAAELIRAAGGLAAGTIAAPLDVLEMRCLGVSGTADTRRHLDTDIELVS